jgi:signal transduction histidine kinase
MLLDDMSADPRSVHPALVAEEGIRSFICVPLRSKEETLGVLNIASQEAHRFTPSDVQLLSSIAAQITVAIENARLHQEVRRKEEVRGELLQDMFLIQEEERRRIARELHDETSQVLASLAANLEVASGMLPADAEKIKNKLKEAQNLSISILDEVHKLIYELRPTLLDDLGLVAAIRWLADNNLKPMGITVNFRTVGKVRRLAPQLETTLFRVIQEAVSNIARHAQAKNADIKLYFRNNVVKVKIGDDGPGFDVEEAMSSKERPRGLGLLGMKERVELMNGTLSIRSRSHGGTDIDIEIPLN